MVIMASLITKAISQVSKRSLMPLSSRLYSDVQDHLKIEPMKGKVADPNVEMPDLMGHAVGKERFELLARQAGEDDPFDMKIRKRAKGTRDEPTIIPSIYHYRLVGCICEEEAVSINWMYLYKGEPRRCNCGYWFNLVDLDIPDYAK